MEDFGPNNIFRKVSSQLFCPACGSKYHGDEIDSIEPKDVGYLVSISCRNCNLSLTMQIVTKNFSHFEDVSDLEDPITIDEIVDFHDQLKSFDGNFRRAFMTTIDPEGKIW